MGLFEQFSLILLVVLAVSFLVRLFKQPLIIGYILSGILIGPSFLNLLNQIEILNFFSEMGIAFLLFIVGLHLSPKVIKEVGKVSLITGIGQIVFTSIIGYFIAILLGFDKITSIYIAIALTFSSTIIIMKLLSDKDALEKLYGKISIGFLLIQDLIVILILVIISSLSIGSGAEDVLLLTLLKGLLIVAVLVILSYYILPKLGDFFAKSQELLFVFAISWGLGLSLIFLHAGFTIEVGALIAGILLSISPYSFEISSKLKPLRDFFIIYFFIILGSQMNFEGLSSLIIPSVIFSVFILIGNPLIVITLMGILGYSKKTGFMAGLTVAQISEFSLILITLGVKVGHITQEVLSFITLVGLLTIAGSTYLIIYSEFFFRKLSPLLSFFERKNIKEKEILKKEYEYVLLGYDRVGFSIVKSLSNQKKNFLVVDYNPNVIKELREKGINTHYGDVDNTEFLEELSLSKASVIISTVPEKETNQLVLDFLKRKGSDAIKILTARQIKDGLDLYNKGADYVILPHILGGKYTSELIKGAKKDKRVYRKERIKEINNLKELLKKRFPK